jgi:hypothetical protein
MKNYLFEFNGVTYEDRQMLSSLDIYWNIYYKNNGNEYDSEKVIMYEPEYEMFTLRIVRYSEEEIIRMISKSLCIQGRLRLFRFSNRCNKNIISSMELNHSLFTRSIQKRKEELERLYTDDYKYYTLNLLLRDMGYYQSLNDIINKILL